VRALQWLAAALNTVEPGLMALMINDVFESDQKWSKPRHAGLAAFVKTRLGELDAALGDKQWLDGDAFTVGDLMMISVLRELHHTDELAAVPRLAAYVARGESRPAFRKALADHMAAFRLPAPA
jgi:glutathione S-transferase